MQFQAAQPAEFDFPEQLEYLHDGVKLTSASHYLRFCPVFDYRQKLLRQGHQSSVKQQPSLMPMHHHVRDRSQGLSFWSFVIGILSLWTAIIAVTLIITNEHYSV